jgi:transcriptional regulator with XRE-family HTH domain
MYSRQAKVSSSGVLKLRREGGRWLKHLREARGLSQRDLADRVGAEYYTFVSQLETGRGRIPPDRYRLWADALGIDPRVFVATLLRYYDPATYAILFGSGDIGEHEVRAQLKAVTDVTGIKESCS